MEIFIKVLQFIASFSLLVIIHELGHFVFAKIFKMKVEKFYLFFNPWFSLWKKDYNGTTYGIGWVPFGGYVKIAGMVDESLDKEQMAQPAKDYEFRSKKPWQRLIVMVAGVFMNIVLAVSIYIGMSYAWGEKYIANDDLKYGYVFNDLGHEVGFADGDLILSINGNHIEDVASIIYDIRIGEARQVEVLRGGEKIEVNISEDYAAQLFKSEGFINMREMFVVAQVTKGSPGEVGGLLQGDTLVSLDGISIQDMGKWSSELDQNKGRQVEVVVSRGVGGVAVLDTLNITVGGDGKLGVMRASPIDYIGVRTHGYTLLQSIPAGVKRTGTTVSNYFKQLKLIFKPKTEAYKQVGGVIAIGNIFPGTWSWHSFWDITAMLSIMLAVLNILPIPGLDGGHMLFCLYEIVTGRKPHEKFMEWATTVGILLLFAVIILANMNDVLRLFIK